MEMSYSFAFAATVLSVSVALAAAPAQAAEQQLPPEATPIARLEVRTTDKTRCPGLFGDHWWANRFLERHALVESMRGRSVDLVLVGDSIVHFWEWRHPDSWRKLQKGRTVLNLGYGGDKTQHVIWRLEHGELDGYTAKNVVLMIGTNNNNWNASNPTNVTKAIETIVALIRRKQPGARLILHPIFPRGNSPVPAANHADARRRNDATNILLKNLAAANPEIIWLDFNARFLDSTGWVPPDLMPDAVHPSDAGYDIWIDALEPVIGPHNECKVKP